MPSLLSFSTCFTFEIFSDFTFFWLVLKYKTLPMNWLLTYDFTGFVAIQFWGAPLCCRRRKGKSNPGYQHFFNLLHFARKFMAHHPVVFEQRAQFRFSITGSRSSTGWSSFCYRMQTRMLSSHPFLQPSTCHASDSNIVNSRSVTYRNWKLARSLQLMVIVDEAAHIWHYRYWQNKWERNRQGPFLQPLCNLNEFFSSANSYSKAFINWVLRSECNA